MFFLNLTAGEFFALLSTLGGVVTALYLLDRRVRKKVVSTLRFWPSAAVADEQTRRKRMRQPWSLILQLISLTLLLLAIAQLQWGSRAGRSRDHVLLLDTSVWSGANASGGSVLDRERQLAARYLGTLPARDRVMLVRVDALASPATPFTSSHAQILSALRESTSGVSALDLRRAFSFAQEAQNWSGGAPGEIVYIGPKRTEIDQPVLVTPANLRVLTVAADGENAGIRKVSVRRSDEEKNSWEAAVTLKNEGLSPRRLTLKTQYAGTRFSPRIYTLRPGEELEAKYNFVTNTAGRLIAEIDGNDSLQSDNRAELQLEGNTSVTVAVYTDRRDALRPLLEANHHLKVEYVEPSRYSSRPAADLMLLDGIAPRQTPAIPSLWIHPPRESSPLPVKTVVKDAVIRTWHTDTLLERGLRGRQDRIGEAEVFGNSDGAVPIASIAEGPVVAALTGSPSEPRSAAIGFDPLAGNLRFTITTPLLFAHLLHWLAPEAFRNSDFVASRVGAIALSLAAEERPDQLRVTDHLGLAVPFSVREQTLELFISKPTIVHIASGDNHERTLSFTLPDVAEGKWNLPANIPADLPLSAAAPPTSVDLWKWLACLGGFGIFAEWWIYGRNRRKLMRQPKPVSKFQSNATPKRERELVSK
jgi:Aerotolerance regulator N-terminal/von Willebrand factor type A domain